MQSVILGCGDVGRRIIKKLLSDEVNVADIAAYVNSQPSQQAARELGVNASIIDLDSLTDDLMMCDGAQLYYTVAPQKKGLSDDRTKAVLRQFGSVQVRPSKVVLISTCLLYTSPSPRDS